MGLVNGRNALFEDLFLEGLSSDRSFLQQICLYARSVYEGDQTVENRELLAVASGAPVLINDRHSLAYQTVKETTFSAVRKTNQ